MRGKQWLALLLCVLLGWMAVGCGEAGVPPYRGAPLPQGGSDTSGASLSPPQDTSATGVVIQAVPARQPMQAANRQVLAVQREAAWVAYVDSLARDMARVAEMEAGALAYGEVTMPFRYTVVGDPDETGYPLYIALHGGGAGDTPDVNNSQWQEMQRYYLDSVDKGIYLAVRGVRDTWDTHFNQESYPLYDRLIENGIALLGADPNRVYLMGYSAGGDGVYAIAPRMADRFAAVHMSAGHPNGVDVLNLKWLPIALQCGEWDESYERNLVTAEYGLRLDALRQQAGDGYTHAVFLHVGRGHGIVDNHPQRVPQTVIADLPAWQAGAQAGLEYDGALAEANTNAVDFLRQYRREPLPREVVWNLAERADLRETDAFYWLASDAREGVVRAWLKPADNSIRVETQGFAGTLTLLLQEEMLDLFAPIALQVDGTTATVSVQPDQALLTETTADRGDPNYQFVAAVTVTVGDTAAATGH